MEKNRNNAPRKAAVLGFLYLHEGREKLKNQKCPNKASPKGSRNPRKHCNMPRAAVQELSAELVHGLLHESLAATWSSPAARGLCPAAVTPLYQQ